MSEFVLSGQELFGRYARIAYGHALGGEQDYHIYKCIQSFRSNCYCDVPLTYQTENNCYNHDDIVDVVNVIHCGIDESRVIRVARNDIELLPAPDVEPVQEWIPVEGRTPGNTGLYLVIEKHWLDGSLGIKIAKWNTVDWFTADRKSKKITPRVTHWMPLPPLPKEVET